MAGVITVVLVLAAAIAGVSLFAISGVERDSHDFGTRLDISVPGGCINQEDVETTSYIFNDVRENDIISLSTISTIQLSGSRTCGPEAEAWWDVYCITASGAEASVINHQTEALTTTNLNLNCAGGVKVDLSVQNTGGIFFDIGWIARGTAKVVGPDVELLSTDTFTDMSGGTIVCDTERCDVEWDYTCSQSGSFVSMSGTNPITFSNSCPVITGRTSAHSQTISESLTQGESLDYCAVSCAGTGSTVNVFTSEFTIEKYAAIGCGDGVIQEDETCDPPNTDTCSPDCKLMVCGDGFNDFNEECDDGNNNNNDGCLNNCKLAQCGDSYVRVDVESCDDGNTNDDDGCSSLCISESCGDGIIQESIEDCDGRNLNGQSCETLGFDGGSLACSYNCEAFATSACVNYGPNNGVVDPGEECDDGDDNTNDNCVNTRDAFCGDSYIDLQSPRIEECELDTDCEQGTTTCDGRLTGTRDGFGSCNGCSCDLEDFTYSYVSGSCGATCSDNDFNDGDGCDSEGILEFCGDEKINNGGAEVCEGDATRSCTTSGGESGQQTCNTCQWTTCDPDPATGSITIIEPKFDQAFSATLVTNNLPSNTQVYGEIRKGTILLQRVQQVMTSNRQVFQFNAIDDSGVFSIQFKYFDQFENPHIVREGTFTIKAPMDISFTFENPVVQYTKDDLVATIAVGCADLCNVDVTNLKVELDQTIVPGRTLLQTTPSFEPLGNNEFRITISKEEFGRGTIYLTDTVIDLLGNHEPQEVVISSKVLRPELLVSAVAPTGSVVGKTETITVLVADENGLKIDPETLFVTANYPDGETERGYNIQDMTRTGEGTYSFDFTFGDFGGQGESYRFLVEASIEGYEIAKLNGNDGFIVSVTGGGALNPGAVTAGTSEGVSIVTIIVVIVVIGVVGFIIFSVVRGNRK